MSYPEGKLARFGKGVELPFRALATIAAHPATWPLVLAPVFLTIGGLLLGIVVGHYAGPWLIARVWTEPTGAAAHFFWAVLLWSLRFTVALSLALAMPTVLGAPFNDRLSAVIENRVLGTEEPEEGLGRFAREILTSLANGVARLIRFGVVQALLFLVSFVPGLNVVYPVLAFLWSAVWLAEQALDQTAARHLFTWRDARDALRTVRPVGFGMGLVLAAVFLVPLANLFLLPVATVSGALLYCDLQKDGQMPSPRPVAG